MIDSTKFTKYVCQHRVFDWLVHGTTASGFHGTTQNLKISTMVLCELPKMVLGQVLWKNPGGSICTFENLVR